MTRDGHVKILDFGLARQILRTQRRRDDAGDRARHRAGHGHGHHRATWHPNRCAGESVDSPRRHLRVRSRALRDAGGRARVRARYWRRDHDGHPSRGSAALSPPIRDSVPPALERVVDHCLEKRPEDRFQSARDLAFALGASASSTSGRAAAAAIIPAPRRNTRESGALHAGNAHRRPRRRRTPLSTTDTLGPRGTTLEVRYLTYSGSDFSPSASPDGRAIAFRSDRDGRARIWVKQLATGTEAALTEGPLDDSPAFSPDGSTILFTRGTGAQARALFRVPLLGGEARRIVEDATDGSWSPDGNRIVFLRMQPASPGKVAATYVMVAASDGTSQRVLTHVAGSALASPHWSPDGRQISLTGTAVGSGSFSLRLVNVDTGAMETAVAPTAGRPWAARWTPSGRLLYTDGQMSAGSLAGTTGRLLAVAPGSNRPQTLFSSADSLGQFAVIDDNRAVVESQVSRQNIVEWSGGRSKPLSLGRASDRQPIYSPDGQWIVFSSDRAGNLDLWASSTSTRRAASTDRRFVTTIGIRRSPRKAACCGARTVAGILRSGSPKPMAAAPSN